MNNVGTLARAPGGRMQGGATQAMRCHRRERQRRGRPPAAAPLWAAARRPAGVFARSSQPARYARRSLHSWSKALETPVPENQTINAVHGVLRTYDLPDLVRLAGPVVVEEPVDAEGKLIQ